MTRKTTLCEGYRDGNGDRLAQSLPVFYLQTPARGHFGNFPFRLRDGPFPAPPCRA